MNFNPMNAMVIVIENGLPTTISFMEAIARKGIADQLDGWWWASDLGLIKDPSQSNEFVIKAQTIYDAINGKPVYVNGVRIFHNQSPGDMRTLMNTHTTNLLETSKELPRIEYEDHTIY